MANGCIIYQGASSIDGQEIAMVATGLPGAGRNVVVRHPEWD